MGEGWVGGSTNDNLVHKPHIIKTTKCVGRGAKNQQF